MSKAVVIGYRDDILPFGVLGFQLIFITSTNDLTTTLMNLLQDATVALIVVSEAVVKDSPVILQPYTISSRIPIVVLPTHRRSYDTGLQETAGIIKKAIGVDILEGAKHEGEQ